MTEGRGRAASIEPPADDQDVPRYWRELGLPGLIDVHVHFLPPRVQAKVWQYFGDGEKHYGVPWPLAYAVPDEERLAILDGLGVRAFPTLPYPHKAGMAAWLNDWSAEFAESHPDPRDPLLDAVWGRLEETGTPVVIHCGSGPLRGEHTGPTPVTGLLERHPRLQLVIAHLGMPEYRDFLELAERYERVHLDTTMFATDFTERLMPFDPADLPRLAALRDKVLLGSDFPSIPYAYAHQLAALHRLDLGEEWLRAVLWGNGASLFGVEA
jgi:hypothetical protein